MGEATMGRQLARTRMRALIALLALALTSGAALGGKVWYPVGVDVWEPPFNPERLRTRRQYTPLHQASRRWNICVSIPHLKDAYWPAVNYGLIAEARRLGVGISLYEAGGYEHLDVQSKQVDDASKTKPTA
jgi:protein TorT